MTHKCEECGKFVSFFIQVWLVSYMSVFSNGQYTERTTEMYRSPGHNAAACLNMHVSSFTAMQTMYVRSMKN